MFEMRLSPSWLHEPAVQQLLAIARAESLMLRFVGGCVRDTLMGRAVGDIDIATPHLPTHIMEAYMRHDVQVIPTGIKHGTVTVRVQVVSFEITTLRRDMACDGRHAEVAFVQEWEADAMRRDFTMNALYMDETGKVVDYVGGIADAKAGLVRFIGKAEERIQEDYLRIVRFFRFYATHGTQPLLAEEIEACRVHRAGLSRIAVERIAVEMQKLFAAPHPTEALQVMQQAGIWEMVAGEVGGNEQRLQSLLHREKSFSSISEGDYPEKIWQRVIAYVGIEGAMALCSRWKLPKKIMRLMQQVQSLPPIHNELEVRLAVEQCNGATEAVRLALMLYAKETEYAGLWDYLHSYLPTPCPITGDTLLQQGFVQGADLREALQRVRDAWVASDGQISVQELLKYAIC